MYIAKSEYAIHVCHIQTPISYLVELGRKHPWVKAGFKMSQMNSKTFFLEDNDEIAKIYM